MGIQFQGKFTRLSPAVLYKGELYGAAVQFLNPGANDTLIVSGTLAENPTGTTEKTLIFERAFQSDSFFVSRLNGGPYEQVFAVFMGGNVAGVHEAARLYNWSNSRNLAGSDARDRLRPGDVIWWQGKGYLVLEVRAFDSAPGSVDFTGGVALPTSVYLDLGGPGSEGGTESDWLDLVLDPPELPEINAAATIHFEDTSLFMFDGATSTAATRTQFTPPGGAGPDPDWYPPDASFASDVPRFWYDEHSHSFRLSSHNAAWGDAVIVVYYHRDLAVATADGVTVIEGSGAGYGGSSDELTLWGRATREDFDATVRLWEYEGTFGSGSLEWRAEAARGAVMVCVEWGGEDVSAVRVRTTPDGTAVSGAFTPKGSAFSAALYAELSIVKSGDTFNLYWKDDSVGARQLIATVVIAGVVSTTPGILSVGNYDAEAAAKVEGLGDDEQLTKIAFAPGVVSQQRTKGWTVEWTKTFGIPGAEPISSVTNVLLPSAPALTEDAAPARDHYTVSGATITFNIEAAGDRIRVTEAAAGTPPSGPGRAPNIPGTVNFATPDESGDFIATTNVNENVANWRDAAVIHDPEEDFLATSGESLDGRRNPVFDSRNPPAIWVDLKDGASDLAVVDPSEYYLRAVEGIMLLKESWLEEFELDDVQMCFVAEDP